MFNYLVVFVLVSLILIQRYNHKDTKYKDTYIILQNVHINGETCHIIE